MKDVQNQRDDRNIYLNQVGIKDLVLPIEIMQKDGAFGVTRASISLAVDLAPEKKGTHMSRFVDIMQNHRRIDIRNVRLILEELRQRLEAENSYITMEFDYFIEKEAPVTAKKSFLDVNVKYSAWIKDGEFEFEMTVNTPVTTLCPCSKEISDYSAHNQRANVAVTIRTGEFIWIEDIVRICEQSASSPVYSVLKRPDEKYVTEFAYENPRFVEDVAREVQIRMAELGDFISYTIEVESFESIHNHSAYAKIIR